VFIGMTNIAIKQGFKASVPFVFGVAAGNIIFSSIAIFGLSEIIFKNTIFSIIFYLLSGFYLIYFGFKLFFEKKSTKEVKTAKSKVFLSGFFIELSNPKSVFFTTTLVAILITPESSFALKIFVLFWMVVVSFIYELSIVLLFSIYRTKLIKILQSLNRIFGVILFVFATRLIFL
jgi:threonine/homoserine/homoserine lactone efflux protein